MKRFLCVVDVLPSGRIAALQIEASDAIAAEAIASARGRERFGGPVEVIEVIPADIVADITAA